MDGSGNIDWSRQLISNSREYHQFRAIITQSQNIVVVGSTIHQLPKGNQEDAFMTKIDFEGNIIWSNAYGSSDNDDWGSAIIETPKSNLIFVGSTKSYGASLFDILLVGTNAEGLSQ
jgi:hypothetical protein